MLDHTVDLSSREIIINRLIRDCLDLPPDRYRRDLPVILLLGTRENGKTALLKEIHRRAGGRPRVLRDLGDSDMRPHEVAVALAFGLSEKVKQFGRLKFPRLALGLVAIRIDADLHNPDQARRNLRNVLSEERRGLIAKLRAIAEGLATELGAPPGAGVALGLALEGAGALWTEKSLRGRPFAWYRDARAVQFEEPLHALLELNLLEIDGTQEGRAEVDKVLCHAFLADLRDAFTTGWQAKARTGNCLVLIDNADSPAGDAFLEILVKERHRHAANTSGDCDPLVVVAIGRTWFPAFALPSGHPRRTRSPRQATEADWADKRDGTPRSWLYPVALDDLDASDDVHDDHPELSSLARQWPHATHVAYVLRKLHELTYGHLLSSDLVLRAVAAEVERAGGNYVDLRGVLDWPDPDHPIKKLAEGLVDRLLPDAPPALRYDLTTCAAAGDVGIPVRWRAVGHPHTPHPELDQFCSTDLWAVRVDPNRGRGQCLHPFLRRVLLHELARRGEHDPDRWEVVHGRLRDYYQGEGRDLTRAMYHTLAAGDLAPVVAHLHQRFAELDKRRWLDELHAITAAPRLAGPATQDARKQATELDGNGDALAQLVARLWISKDPLGDPDRTLDVRIEAHLKELAKLPSPEADVLYDEAQRYQKRGQRECWARWPPAGSGGNRQDDNA